MAEEEKSIQDVALGAVDGELVDEGNLVKLSKPLNGRTELLLDFDKVNGITLLDCEKRARKTDTSILVPQLSTVYRAHIAAAASGMRYDDIIHLSGTDFTAVTNRVASFLSGME